MQARTAGVRLDTTIAARFSTPAPSIIGSNVEKRFGTIHAPYPVQWLSDNGSIFAAHKTIEIALALNLAPCFTPVESPESDGMAEAFLKTFKRGSSVRYPMPLPPSLPTTGWRFTIPCGSARRRDIPRDYDHRTSHVACRPSRAAASGRRLCV
jgi:transposase InsO family protein